MACTAQRSAGGDTASQGYSGHPVPSPSLVRRAHVAEPLPKGRDPLGVEVVGPGLQCRGLAAVLVVVLDQRAQVGGATVEVQDEDFERKLPDDRSARNVNV